MYFSSRLHFWLCSVISNCLIPSFGSVGSHCGKCLGVLGQSCLLFEDCSLTLSFTSEILEKHCIRSFKELPVGEKGGEGERAEEMWVTCHTKVGGEGGRGGIISCSFSAQTIS